ncbi:hypothetical protein KJF94_21140 [Pseudomonas hormoni]|uniref:Uncharacterized protein n=1 Tax=Pseudomonas hormoni TaxID=3093767 RepID=A0ABX8ERE5_9PSED|nr:hypothetical protein [Pseudomonas hormoni]QVW22359.1 hypothetical protein KJF94_21140 [Pseudomonas hormoni]
MSTNRQKSFLATLAFHGKPAAIISHSGNTAPVWGQANNGVADVLYFRCDGDTYTLYIRTEGKHFGKTIDRVENFFTTSTARNTTTFDIIGENGKVITLDQLDTDKEVIALQTRSGDLLKTEVVWTDEPKRIMLNGQSPITFGLKILERNVPYLSHPDEV